MKEKRTFYFSKTDNEKKKYLFLAVDKNNNEFFYTANIITELKDEYGFKDKIIVLEDFLINLDFYIIKNDNRIKIEINNKDLLINNNLNEIEKTIQEFIYFKNIGDITPINYLKDINDKSLFTKYCNIKKKKS